MATPGQLTLDGGALLATETFTLAANRGVALQGTGSIAVSDTKLLTVAGSVADGAAPGRLAKGGDGVLVLGTSNTYTGGTTVTAGTLSISADNQLGTAPGVATAGQLALNGGTLLATQSFTLADNRGVALQGTGSVEVAATKVLTVAGAVADGAAQGSLAKTGDGTLVLGATDAYTGTTTVSAGQLKLLGGDAIADQAGLVTVNAGGTLVIGAAETLSRIAGAGTLTLDATLTTGNGLDSIYSGAVGGLGGLIKQGNGTLTLSNAAANTYSGSTTVGAGTLSISADHQLGAVPGAATPGQLALTGGMLLATENFTLAANRGVALQGTGRIAVADTKLLTVAGTVADGAGQGSLAKTGAGTLVLSVANTYSGSTTVDAGTLSIGADNQLGAVPGAATPGQLALQGGTLLATQSFTLAANRGVALQGTGSIEVADTKQLLVAGIVADGAGPGRLAKTGAGTLALGAANTYSGSTTLSAGTLSISADNQLGTAPGVATAGQLAIHGGTLLATDSFTLATNRGVALQAATTLEVATGKSLTVASDVVDGAGAGSVRKTGAGVLVLRGNNSYSGGTTLAAGTLTQASANAIGSLGTVSFEGGVLQYSAASFADQSARFSSGPGQLFRLDTNGQTVRLASNLSSDAGTLSKLGAGTLVLAGSNSFGGGISVQAGSLSLGSANALGSVGTISFGGGALQFSAANNTDYSPRFSTAASQAVQLDTNGRDVDLVANLASVGGTLTKTGVGVLTVRGANTYTGGTQLNGGSLALGSDGALGSSGNISFGGGTLRFSAANTRDYSARFSNAAAQQFRFDTNGQQVTLLGNLVSSGGSLTKLEAGTLTLLGASSFDGGTAVQGGTLALSGPATAAGTGAITVGAATLDLRNGAAVANSVTLGADATLANTAGRGTLLASGNLALAGDANLVVSGAGTGLSVLGRISETVVGRHLSTSGNTVTLANHNSYTGGTTVLAGTLAIDAASVADADAGSGPLVLGANTLLVNNGAVLGNALALAGATVSNTAGRGTLAGPVTLSGSNVLQSSGTGLQLSGQVVGTGGVVANGGSITLSGTNNNYSGATVVTAGSLTAMGGTAIGDLSAVTLSGIASVVLGSSEVIGSLAGSAGTTVSLGDHSLTTGGNNAVSTLFGGVFTGGVDSGLVKTGSGSFTLAGDNRHAGSTTVNDGTLALAGAGRLAATSSLVVSAGAFDLGGLADTVAAVRLTGGSIRNGILTSTSAFDLQAGNIGAVLAGNAGLRKTSGGVVTLTAANSLTGTVVVEDGNVLLSGAGAHLDAAVTLDVRGGVLDLGGNAQAVAALQQTGGALRNGTLTSASTVDLRAGTINAVLAGSAGLHKSGTGTATLGASNTDGSTTTVDSGTLALAGAGRLADASQLVVNGGAFDLGGLADTVAGVRQTGGAIVNGTLISTTAFDMQAGTVSAALAGAVGLNKTTSGTTTLTGANAYTGITTVGDGVLALGAFNERLANVSRVVVNGGTFDLGGFTQTVDAVQQDGGQISNGNLVSAHNFDMRAGTVSAALAGTQGSVGLLKTTAGTLTLRGTNTYTGLTDVQAGLLQLAGPQILASDSTARVAAGATLSLAGAQDLASLDLAGRLAGTGPLVTPDFRSSSGRIDLPLTAATLDISGETQINADATVGAVRVLAGGELALSSTGRLINTGDLSVAPAALLRLLSAQTVGSFSLGGTLVGTGVLTAGSYLLQGGQVLAPLGTGALTSTGASLLNAPAAVQSLRVQGGTLSTGALGSLDALPAVQVDANASWALGGSQRIGSLSGAGRVDLGSNSLRTGVAASSRFDGVIAGSGSLVKQGERSFSLAGSNTFSGDTVVEQGTLALLGADRLADTTAVQVAAGATLSLDAQDTVASLTLAGTLAGSGTLTAALYQLQGGSTLAALGRGVLVSDGISSLGRPAAVDSISVRSGSLQLADGAPTRAPITQVAADASLALAGDATLGSLAGAGTVQLAAAPLRTGVAGDSRFDGVITGSGGLIKQGDSRFTLAGANRYAGNTKVEQGTLALAGDDRLPDASAVTVARGAVLALSGQDTVASLLLQGTLAGSGTLSAASYTLDGGSALADLGAGLLFSSGSSSLAGQAGASAVQVQDGQLRLVGPQRLAAGSSVSVANGARLTLAGDQRIDSLGLSGTLDGSGTLQARSALLEGGSVQADLAADQLNSKGASQLLGQATANVITVQDGSLSLQGANRLLALPALVLQGSAHLVLGGDTSLGNLSSAQGEGQVDLGAFTLSTGARADSSFGGVIAGNGGLVKRGADTTFGLTGDSSYRGSTWVAEGTLALGDGGTNGALATSGFVVDGVLQSRRADAVHFDQPISGSGVLEQWGTRADSALVLQGNNKTYTGATRVRTGELRTAGDEALSGASDLQVDAGASLVLGGAETLRSITAQGTVVINSSLTSTGAMLLNGAVVAADGGAALSLHAASIEAMSPGNRWGGALSIETNGALKLAAGSDAGGRLPLTLGTVQVGGGGRLEASTLVLNGATTLRGASLVLDLDHGEVLIEPSGALLGKLTPANRQIALTQDVLTQGADGRITVTDGGMLDVRASGGGSVALLNEANRFEGNGLSVVVGAPDQPWKANVKTPQLGGIELSLQNQVQVSGTQVDVGGAGIQADLVAIKAGGVRTLDASQIVAKLPYDNLVGTTQSLPAMRFELTDLAFTTPGSYGLAGTGINISVGSKLFGARTVLPLDSGFLTVLPLGGARGSTALLLTGPIVGGSYSFFYSGAGQQGELPVFYNGVSAITPQVSGSISSTLSVSEGARKERFEEAVRTENVALRLRAGVIAEVGPGTPATVNAMPMDKMRPPACSPAPGTLACPAP